jgi:hypothetical protein
MVHEKIVDSALALGGLAGQVDQEQWDTIRRVRQELFDAADQAQRLEQNLEVPQSEIRSASATMSEQLERESFFKETYPAENEEAGA